MNMCASRTIAHEFDFLLGNILRNTDPYNEKSHLQEFYLELQSMPKASGFDLLGNICAYY